jgi:hypothetical protein
MISAYNEFMPPLIFITVMLTALLVNKLRQEVRELNEILQRRLPPDPEVIEPE